MRAGDVVEATINPHATYLVHSWRNEKGKDTLEVTYGPFTEEGAIKHVVEHPPKTTSDGAIITHRVARLIPVFIDGVLAYEATP